MAGLKLCFAAVPVLFAFLAVVSRPAFTTIPAEEAVTLVTGGAGGLGRGIVQNLHRHGYHVFVGVRKQADADSVNSEFGKGSKVYPIILDVTKSDHIEDAVATVRKYITANPGTKFYALFNNAGVMFTNVAEGVSAQSRDQIFEVNVYSLLEMSKAFLPLMHEAGAGRIVNTGSIAGSLGMAYNSLYGSSKATVAQISYSMRHELIPSNIAVTNVIQGPVYTDMPEAGAAKGIADLKKLSPEMRDRHQAGIELELKKMQDFMFKPGQTGHGMIAVDFQASRYVDLLQSTTPPQVFYPSFMSRMMDYMSMLPEGIFLKVFS